MQLRDAMNMAKDEASRSQMKDVQNDIKESNRLLSMRADISMHKLGGNMTTPEGYFIPKRTTAIFLSICRTSILKHMNAQNYLFLADGIMQQRKQCRHTCVLLYDHDCALDWNWPKQRLTGSFQNRFRRTILELLKKMRSNLDYPEAFRCCSYPGLCL